MVSFTHCQLKEELAKSGVSVRTSGYFGAFADKVPCNHPDAHVQSHESENLQCMIPCLTVAEGHAVGVRLIPSP